MGINTLKERCGQKGDLLEIKSYLEGAVAGVEMRGWSRGLWLPRDPKSFNILLLLGAERLSTARALQGDRAENQSAG